MHYALLVLLLCGALTVKDRASLGVAVAYALVRPAAPPPPPQPVGKVCPDCAPEGHPSYPDHPGKVGDGTVFMDCPNSECPYKPALPPAPPEVEKPKPVAVIGPERYAVPPKGDRRTFRKVCRNGECMWEPLP